MVKILSSVLEHVRFAIMKHNTQIALFRRLLETKTQAHKTSGDRVGGRDGITDSRIMKLWEV